MDLSWLTIRDLEYVASVAQHLHFRKAAEACRVSQPALSTQIKKVEDQLGVMIFERTNRRVQLTPRGQILVKQVSKILEEVQLLGNLSKSDSAPLSGPFRLGVIATLGPYLMPYLLSPLRKKFPNLILHLKEGLTDSLLAQLRNGDLDAVLAADTFSEGSLKKLPLFHEPFLVTVPKGHELAQRKTLSPKDLEPERMILLEDGHCLTAQTLSICQRKKGSPREAFQATSLETLRHMVASGSGYTLIPALAATSDPKLTSLIEYLEFKSPVGRKIILVYRDSYPNKDDCETLADFIIHHLPARVTSLIKNATP